MDKSRTTDQETKLSYRLRQLSAIEREQLLDQLGMAKTTLYARVANPRKLTLDEASTISRFLEAIDGEDYDMFALLEPVNLRA